MGNWVLGFVMNHQEYFIGLGCGYAIAHIPEAVLFAFKLAMRIPWLRDAVRKNPAKAKAIVDAIRDELDKDIDAEAATAAPTPATPAPTPAP